MPQDSIVTLECIRAYEFGKTYKLGASKKYDEDKNEFQDCYDIKLKTEQDGMSAETAEDTDPRQAAEAAQAEAISSPHGKSFG